MCLWGAHVSTLRGVSPRWPADRQRWPSRLPYVVVVEPAQLVGGVGVINGHCVPHEAFPAPVAPATGCQLTRLPGAFGEDLHVHPLIPGQVLVVGGGHGLRLRSAGGLAVGAGRRSAADGGGVAAAPVVARLVQVEPRQRLRLTVQLCVDLTRQSVTGCAFFRAKLAELLPWLPSVCAL